MKSYTVKNWFFILAMAIGVCACSMMLPAKSHAGQKELKIVSVITSDELMGTMDEPRAIFYDEAKQRLYVADTVNNRLVSFDKNFKFLSELMDVSFALPIGVVKGSGGEFFIVDAKTSDIKVIDTGTMQIKPLSIMKMPRERDIFIPGGLAVDTKGRLYVVDKLNKIIVVLKQDGTFLRSIKVKKRGFYGFDDMRVDEKGFVYAVDAVGATAYVFDDSGKLVLSFGNKGKGALDFPVSIAVNRAGDSIYVLDRHKGAIVVFNAKGSWKNTFLTRGVKEHWSYTALHIYIWTILKEFLP